MLHGTLPKAYLPPGLSYFGGYYGEELQPTYPQVAVYVGLEDAYTRLPEHRMLPVPWEAAATAQIRAASPLPLDLSLKPQVSCSSGASSPRTEEPIEVDDEEDRKDRVQRRLDTKIYPDEPMLEEEHQRAVDILRPDSLDLTRLGYPDPRKYQYPAQKLVLGSPTQLQSVSSYHQQFLMTPQQNQLPGIHAPMTPPSTPSPPQCTKRRPKEEDTQSSPVDAPPAKQSSIQTVEKITKAKKKHVARRLKFDEDTSSPVSGTVILGPDEAVVTGDIDPAFNVVEVTEEARAELAKIENRLGPYQCKLCRQLYEDAFQLAQHRCSRIAHVEYRCPECDKRFSCPANLASHRRWHKPRVAETTNTLALGTSGEIACTKCDAKFSRQTALKKHMSVQHAETNNNDNTNINNNNKALDETGRIITDPQHANTSTTNDTT